MSIPQVRQLQVTDRVNWCGLTVHTGTVEEVTSEAVVILWEDGRRSRLRFDGDERVRHLQCAR